MCMVTGYRCPITAASSCLLGQTGVSHKSEFSGWKRFKAEEDWCCRKICVIGRNKCDVLVRLHNFTGTELGGRFVRISKKVWVAAYTKLDEHNAVISCLQELGKSTLQKELVQNELPPDVNCRVLSVMFIALQVLKLFHLYNGRCSAHGISKDKCYLRPLLPYSLTSLEQISSPYVTNDMWPTNPLCSPLIKMVGIWRMACTCQFVVSPSLHPEQ